MVRPRVVILGGGFGGLNAAKALRRVPVDVVLVDRRNHHLFQPLLYQVATAALNPSDIASPIRKVLRRQRNARVLLAQARAVDTAGRRVLLDDGELPYDYLVVATGATHAYFGRDDWMPHAPGLKSIEDALDIRRRVLTAFEEAEREPDEARRREWLTFVIVGGGPTGVEMAGALAEVARHSLAADFRVIDPRTARVVLLEGQSRLLAGMDERLSEKARKQLEKLGVEVRTGCRVTSIDGESVGAGDERIRARTVIWAAGVSASPIGASLGAPTDRAGRVKVAADLSIPGHPEVFVVGDLAILDQDGRPVTGLAPIAIQEGRHAARQIQRTIEGRPREPFRYRDKGLLATVGRAAAVAQFRKLRLSGYLAWAAWLFVHILFLIGFRNRLLVMFSWAWVYWTYERGARLITGESPRRHDAGSR